jgi:hypothetical protein
VFIKKITPVDAPFKMISTARNIIIHASDIWVIPGGSRNEERLEQKWGFQP